MRNLPAPEPALPPRPSWLAALQALAAELTGEDRATTDFAHLLATLCRPAHALCAALHIADAHGTLRTAVTYGCEATDFRLLPGTGVAGRVLRSGQPILVPYVHREPMAIDELVGSPALTEPQSSMLCVPVSVESRHPGALAVYFLDPEAPSDALPAMQVASVLLRFALSVSAHGPSTRLEPVPDILPEGPTNSRDLASGGFDYANMVGDSLAMRGVYEQIGQVAGTSATALLRGESGTGKELVAQAIHRNSPRATKPFVKINCAALPEALFESELFGHERGSFTGAHSQRKGRFELADGGTLFLDEVGELSLTTQAKLLRALQFREFDRVGGTTTLRTNVRVIAATNVDLEEAVKRGTFRDDLFYRLDVFTIHVPPLRERAADIPALALHMLEKYCREHDRNIHRISQGALELLCRYEYPGNVRELENMIERAVVLCDSHVIQRHHLPAALHPSDTLRSPPPEPRTLAASVEQLERNMIEAALAKAKGNGSRAARALGTSERVLRYKLGKYGIDSTRFRG